MKRISVLFLFALMSSLPIVGHGGEPFMVFGNVKITRGMAFDECKGLLEREFDIKESPRDQDGHSLSFKLTDTTTGTFMNSGGYPWGIAKSSTIKGDLVRAYDILFKALRDASAKTGDKVDLGDNLVRPQYQRPVRPNEHKHHSTKDEYLKYLDRTKSNLAKVITQSSKSKTANYESMVFVFDLGVHVRFLKIEKNPPTQNEVPSVEFIITESVIDLNK